MSQRDIDCQLSSFKLKLNQDNTVNITSVKEKMYSREDVETLIKESFVKGMEISEWNQPWTKTKLFLKNWIKENL